VHAPLNGAERGASRRAFKRLFHGSGRASRTLSSTPSVSGAVAHHLKRAVLRDGASRKAPLAGSQHPSREMDRRGPDTARAPACEAKAGAPLPTKARAFSGRRPPAIRSSASPPLVFRFVPPSRRLAKRPSVDEAAWDVGEARNIVKNKFLVRGS
jgi:hypothetical protein